jgi:6-phosphogluconolactonase
LEFRPGLKLRLIRGFLSVQSLCALVALATGGGRALGSDELLTYVGTYTGEKSRGIYLSRFDPRNGRLSTAELAAETKNASFLAVHPKQHVLYAVGEVEDFGGRETGSVSAYDFDAKSGKLTLLNQQPSGGTDPCHLAVDATGRCLLVANYGSGSIAALPLRPDGSLGPPSTVIQHHGSSVNPQRQAGPHAHYITPDPANRFALVCDLGLDQILLYRFDPAKSLLAPSDPPSVTLKRGAGPRHLAFAPDGRRAYVINEMGSTLTAFGYDAKKAILTELQTISTLPERFTGQSTCAEVQVHPSGKFVYASNRGDDSIAIFAAELRTSALTAVGREPTRGKTPRHFALAPGGKWLLAENQDSNEVVVFGVDSRTGKLSATGSTLEVGSPVCIVFAVTSSF